MGIWNELTKRVEQFDPVSPQGFVSKMVGLTIEAQGPTMGVGEYCHIVSGQTGALIPAEVVGFNGCTVFLMPLTEREGMAPGDRVIPLNYKLSVGVGQGLLGRTLDGLGQPLDGLPLATQENYPIMKNAPNALSRPRICQPLSVGVRAIDSLLTLGLGQRMGIFAGSGVGKSTLLGMMARNTTADVNVIALIGERGREVREFIENDLGPEGLANSVVVVATSDQPALIRLKAAFTATAIAEYFRDQGNQVLLLMDSVTRFAMAQREVGLSLGEPPATRGYPPSVFSLLPRLLERSGMTELGSITGVYTVLVDGDDHNEPIADALRGLLDGHVVLSRDLAARNHFPAIDVLQSISRVMKDVVGEEHQQLANEIRKHLAIYHDAKDLIDIGAYVQGSNSGIDAAISCIESISRFQQQKVDEKIEFSDLMPLMRAALPD